MEYRRDIPVFFEDDSEDFSVGTYQFTNPHPKGKRVKDCVKRAIVLAEDADYMDIQRTLNRIKKEVGAKAYNYDSVWKTYIERKGYKKMSFPAVKGKKRMNGHRFATKYDKGVYILNMARHISVCIDGVIHDTWDCRDKCVYTAYKVR